jgi:hypothetical protein
MLSVANRVGRLFEVRLIAPIALNEVTAAMEQFALGEARHGAAGTLAAVDLRTSPVSTPEVADAIVALFRANNRSVKRSAILMGSRAAAGMQIERLLERAANPRRALFVHVEPAVEFLSAEATALEAMRARVFLTELVAKLP